MLRSAPSRTDLPLGSGGDSPSRVSGTPPNAGPALPRAAPSLRRRSSSDYSLPTYQTAHGIRMVKLHDKLRRHDPIFHGRTDRSKIIDDSTNNTFSLVDVIMNTDLRSALCAFAGQEFAEENIIFVETVLNFKQNRNSASISGIVHDYILPDSPMSLNLPHKTRIQTLAASQKYLIQAGARGSRLSAASHPSESAGSSHSSLALPATGSDSGPGSGSACSASGCPGAGAGAGAAEDAPTSGPVERLASPAGRLSKLSPGRLFRGGSSAEPPAADPGPTAAPGSPLGPATSMSSLASVSSAGSASTGRPATPTSARASSIKNFFLGGNRPRSTSVSSSRSTECEDLAALSHADMALSAAESAGAFVPDGWTGSGTQWFDAANGPSPVPGAAPHRLSPLPVGYSASVADLGGGGGGGGGSSSSSASPHHPQQGHYHHHHHHQHGQPIEQSHSCPGLLTLPARPSPGLAPMNACPAAGPGSCHSRTGAWFGGSAGEYFTPEGGWSPGAPASPTSLPGDCYPVSSCSGHLYDTASLSSTSRSPGGSPTPPPGGALDRAAAVAAAAAAAAADGITDRWTQSLTSLIGGQDLLLDGPGPGSASAGSLTTSTDLQLAGAGHHPREDSSDREEELRVFDAALDEVLRLIEVSIYPRFLKMYLDSPYHISPTLPEGVRRVVVVGGGMVGAYAAMVLDQMPRFHVTLIDNKNYFEFTPGIAQAWGDPATAERFRFPHSRYIHRGRVVQGYCCEVQRGAVRVNNADVPYDYLILGCGSLHNTPIKSDNSTIAFRLKKLASEGRDITEAGSLVIIGGGAVGVQLACDFAERFPDKRITLVSSSHCLLKRLPRKAHQIASRNLERLGVSVLLGQRVVGVDVDGTVLQTADGLLLPCDKYIVAVGMVPQTQFLRRSMPEILDDAGFIRVQATLQVEGHQQIFSGGDACNLTCEKLALTAASHGVTIARNICRLEKHKPPVRLGERGAAASPDRPISQIVSLGQNNAVIALRGASAAEGRKYLRAKRDRESSILSMLVDQSLAKSSLGRVPRVLSRDD
ncbi:hypothetical protein H696_05598 [Fonticula alba]|uniref:RGS domain-containing protein n=1 Tax=Fonticula alba TaxID=691883 RepID=A0A058Z1R0_FONAL|nr:hypothetical protein H696_05598 [Fonticula alba]KCV67868.1 hypothetical protein H696_05598 [Fonticula alba]|eukprot:XP_009497688.1 hypothetical protein H696_05598 [Fonticula alba]